MAYLLDALLLAGFLSDDVFSRDSERVARVVPTPHLLGSKSSMWPGCVTANRLVITDIQVENRAAASVAGQQSAQHRRVFSGPEDSLQDHIPAVVEKETNGVLDELGDEATRVILFPEHNAPKVILAHESAAPPRLFAHEVRYSRFPAAGVASN